MPLYYELNRVFHSHENSINAVRFNKAGTLITSGDVDGRLCIWEKEGGRLVLNELLSSPIVAIEWYEFAEETLLVGLRNGRVFVYALNPSNHLLSTLDFFKAHASEHTDDGVRNIAVSLDPTTMFPLATSSGKEVKFWKPCLSGLKWESVGARLRDENWDLVSLHWAKDTPEHIILGDASGKVLFANATNGNFLRQYQLHSRLGSLSSSPIGPYICVHNLSGAFVVYSIQQRRAIHSFRYDEGENIQLPSLFIHNGHALAVGSSLGDVTVWDVDKGAKIQTLKHAAVADSPMLSCPETSDTPKVSAISHFVDVTDGSLYIAISVAEFGRQSYVSLWKSTEKREVAGVRISKSAIVIVISLALVTRLAIDDWLNDRNEQVKAATFIADAIHLSEKLLPAIALFVVVCKFALQLVGA